jgi:hypothetical protein
VIRAVFSCANGPRESCGEVAMADVDAVVAGRRCRVFVYPGQIVKVCGGRTAKPARLKLQGMSSVLYSMMFGKRKSLRRQEWWLLWVKRSRCLIVDRLVRRWMSELREEFDARKESCCLVTKLNSVDVSYGLLIACFLSSLILLE